MKLVLFKFWQKNFNCWAKFLLQAKIFLPLAWNNNRSKFSFSLTTRIIEGGKQIFFETTSGWFDPLLPWELSNKKSRAPIRPTYKCSLAALGAAEERTLTKGWQVQVRRRSWAIFKVPGSCAVIWRSVLFHNFRYELTTRWTTSKLTLNSPNLKICLLSFDRGS